MFGASGFLQIIGGCMDRVSPDFDFCFNHEINPWQYK